MNAVPSIQSMSDELAGQLDATVQTGPARELRLRVQPDQFAGAVHELHAAGARFVTMFLTASPGQTLAGVFALRGQLVVLQATVTADRPLRDDRIGSWWASVAWAGSGPAGPLRVGVGRVHDPVRPGPVRDL
jgi:hypothetical protein